MKVSIKKKMILCFVFAVFIIRCNNPEVDLTIASVFSDKMVLQQAQSNSVWGEAKPNSIITITTLIGISVGAYFGSGDKIPDKYIYRIYTITLFIISIYMFRHYW